MSKRYRRFTRRANPAPNGAYRVYGYTFARNFLGERVKHSSVQSWNAVIVRCPWCEAGTEHLQEGHTWVCRACGEYFHGEKPGPGVEHSAKRKVAARKVARIRAELKAHGAGAFVEKREAAGALEIIADEIHRREL